MGRVPRGEDAPCDRQGGWLRGPVGLKAPAQRRIKSHNEYSPWIHVVVINSHICMEIRLASYFSSGAHFGVSEGCRKAQRWPPKHTQAHLLWTHTGAKTPALSFFCLGRVCILRRHASIIKSLFAPYSRRSLHCHSSELLTLNAFFVLCVSSSCYFSSLQCHSH